MAAAWLREEPLCAMQILIVIKYVQALSIFLSLCKAAALAMQ